MRKALSVFRRAYLHVEVYSGFRILHIGNVVRASVSVMYEKKRKYKHNKHDVQRQQQLKQQHDNQKQQQNQSSTAAAASSNQKSPNSNVHLASFCAL